MSNDKSRKWDGLLVEFYKIFSDWINGDLLQVYQEALGQGTLGKIINKGIIKLLPKGGDKTLIKKLRPITLLNVSYKILEKVLELR